MIIFIHGDNTFSSRQHLNNLKNKYLTEIDTLGHNLTNINGETTNLSEINNAINTVSLLVRKRMVIITNLFKNKSEENLKNITNFFKEASNNESNETIIIIYEHISEKERLTKIKKELLAILKNTKYSPKPFNKLSNQQITNWIISEIQSKGSNISYNAANLLCTAINGDLWAANSEINKLINYKHPNTIETEDVKIMVTMPFNDNIFGLTDAIGANNASHAINLLNNQFESGSNEFQILEMVRRHFKILLQIKTQIEKNQTQKQIATHTKLHPFVVQKSIAQTKNFTKKKLIDLSNQLTNIDYLAKTGKAKAKNMLETLIVSL